MDIQYLQQCSLSELESLYNNLQHSFSVPSGCYSGTCLSRLDQPGFRRPLWFCSKAFEYVPFGIDFDGGYWYFFHPKLRTFHFRPEIRPSRWREGNVVALNYDVSHFPSPIRDILYDEVKPLSDNLYLGIGGFKRESGVGDHGFFFLVRRS